MTEGEQKKVLPQKVWVSTAQKWPYVTAVLERVVVHSLVLFHDCADGG